MLACHLTCESRQAIIHEKVAPLLEHIYTTIDRPILVRRRHYVDDRLQGQY